MRGCRGGWGGKCEGVEGEDVSEEDSGPFPLDLSAKHIGGHKSHLLTQVVVFT